MHAHVSKGKATPLIQYIHKQTATNLAIIKKEWIIHVLLNHKEVTHYYQLPDMIDKNSSINTQILFLLMVEKK